MTIEDTTPPAAPDADVTARLEALGPMVKQIEMDNPSPESQQAAQQQAENISQAEEGARDWGMQIYALGSMFCMIAPELRPVYSQERCIEAGASMHLVCKKYGWSGPGNLPELVLLASIISLGVPTWLILKQKIEDLKTKNDGSVAAKLGAWWRNRGAKPAEASS